MPDPPVQAASTQVVAADRLYLWDSQTAEAAAYDDTSRAWTRLPDAPIAPRYGAAVFAVGDRVVVWGGNQTKKRDHQPFDAEIIEPGPPLVDGAIFDAATAAWSLIPDAPIPGRTNAAGAAAGSDRFVVWGGDNQEKTTQGSRTVVRADGASYATAGDGARVENTTLPAPATTAPRATFAPPQSGVN